MEARIAVRPNALTKNGPTTETIVRIPVIRPDPSAGLVPQLRLIEQLNAGPPGRLTLISALAGFGEITRVSDWLSLDEEDNDLARFF